VRIDLHTHSSASDGTEPPAEVMRRAGQAGLDVVALTDHDTLAGHAEARRALPPGLELLPGMELSCLLDGCSVHMLAYGIAPEGTELAAECAAIVDERRTRARAMVERLRELGADITWPQVEALAAGGVVGRPHIARALTAAGVIGAPEEAFTQDWIGAGGRAYVSRYAPDPVRGIGLIRDAGGVAVLAHPGVDSRSGPLTDETIARLADAGLAGLEIDHPGHDQAVRSRLGVLAADLDLVRTGGSDDHGGLTGYRLGQETCAPEAYERLMSRRGN
jgi:predicted metal-dependent phosphoesterase TrpH